MVACVLAYTVRVELLGLLSQRGLGILRFPPVNVLSFPFSSSTVR